MLVALDSNILDDASPFSLAAQNLLKRLEDEASQVYISTDNFLDFITRS
jgi:hypothetical protein